MNNQTSAIWRVLDLVLPHYCHLCDSPSSSPLCLGCKKDLRKNTTGCRRCDLPLNMEGEFCPACLKTPPAFDRALSAYVYNTTSAQLINQFKHRQNTSWAGYLVKELIARLEYEYRDTSLPGLVIPTPLYWLKQFKRGFNQSEIIAHAIAKHFQIETLKVVRKVKNTQEQQSLTRQKRLRNLKNSFEITSPLTVSHVALIDDVMTTGATAEIIAQRLKQAGAERVDIWALARTPKDRLPNHSRK